METDVLCLFCFGVFLLKKIHYQNYSIPIYSQQFQKNKASQGGYFNSIGLVNTYRL